MARVRFEMETAAAAKRDGEVREIAADAGLLGVGFVRGAGAARVGIRKHDVVVDPVADSLYARPPRLRVAEKIPCDLRKQIGFAVTAGQQEAQRVVGQICHGMLNGIGDGDIGFARIAHDAAAFEFNASGGSRETGAAVSKGIAILPDRNIGSGD